jgi:hypothetical protein
MITAPPASPHIILCVGERCCHDLKTFWKRVNFSTISHMLSFVSRELLDLRRAAQTTTVRALYGGEDDLPNRGSVSIIHALGRFRVRHQRCRMFESSSLLREQIRFWERILDEDWAARKNPADRSARQIRAGRVARLPNQSRPVRSLYPSGPVHSATRQSQADHSARQIQSAHPYFSPPRSLSLLFGR